MPELPEVETVVRTLEKQIKNAVIQSVDIYYDKIVDNVSSDEFKKALVNQRFEKFDRRGKFLVFSLTDYVLISHLRMEGKYFVFHEKTTVDKHTHIVFNLDIGQLHYNDVRKFGRFYLYKKGQELLALSQLGKEPFDETLTAKYCRNYCKNVTTEIKYQLLDQAMITGIGNIYADEICFLAKINPFVKSCYVSLEKWDEIIKATKEVLSQAIKAGGTTIRSYTSSLGVTGLFQQQLHVHSQENCDECNSEIIRIKLHGRSTYYCPNCQKEKPLKIAITGTIGSGKSTVKKHLDKLGYKTISCDEINNDLLQQEYVKDKLAEIFDCQKQEVTKQLITEKIFSNEQLKEKVESYLHQQILSEVNKFIENNCDEKLLFVEVPLLFETNWDYYFDYNVLVVSDNDKLISRLKNKRRMSSKDIERRINSQMSVLDKEQRADYIIENNDSIANLQKKVEKLISKITPINK